MARFFLATVNHTFTNTTHWVETMFNEDAVEHIESRDHRAFIKLKNFNESLECKETLNELKARIFPRQKSFLEKLGSLWD